ncbi:hypothetical protein Tco_0999439, partial [Tanacetum coccineum]
DGKKIIVTKSIVRRDLQLEDAEGMDCLPNATIFEELTRMGYEKISQKLTFYKAFFSPQWKFLIHTILQCLSSKTTAWNEFSSTMASAIICLATNQKFNFSKYIFESMVKNLDNVGKFLMYPRFIQVFLDKQLEGVPTHNRTYIAPSHTKKIFGNMRRVGKGFSGRETPLFQTMVVQDQADMGEGSANPADPHHTCSVIQPSTSQPHKTQKPRRLKRKDTKVPQLLGIKGLLQVSTASGGPRHQDSMGDTIAQTRFNNVSKISNDPLLVRDNEIASLKRRVKKLERRNKSRTHRLKRMYRVGLTTRVESSGDEFGLTSTKIPQRIKLKNNPVSKETQYAVFKIWNEYNILEDIKRGPYSKKSPIRRIQLMDTPFNLASSVRHPTYHETTTDQVKMDDPNITMEEYIRLEEEKARRRGKVYNWETATYGKIWDNEDVHDLGSVETEFPAIVFNDTLTSEAALSCEPTVSSLNNDEIDFRISFDESDDEDCTIIFDKNSFSYKIIYVNDLKTDSENDDDKVNMPLFPSPKPTVSMRRILGNGYGVSTSCTVLGPRERNIDEYCWRI